MSERDGGDEQACRIKGTALIRYPRRFKNRGLDAMNGGYVQIESNGTGYWYRPNDNGEMIPRNLYKESECEQYVTDGAWIEIVDHHIPTANLPQLAALRDENWRLRAALEGIRDSSDLYESEDHACKLLGKVYEIAQQALAHDASKE